MAGKRSLPSKESYDTFYCSIDRWQRTYRLGVFPSSQLDDRGEMTGELYEHDHLQIFGTIRHHIKYRKSRSRAGQTIELWVSPTFVPRDQWRNDPGAVGNVFTEKGKVVGVLRLAADTFYSFFQSLTESHFKELEMRVRDLRYRHGKMEGIEFAPEETPIEDLLQ